VAEEAQRSSSQVDGELRLLWPQLTRFYGIGPTELAVTPRSIIRLYANAIPALSADEQLMRLEASVYPHMKQADARRVARDRQRDAKRMFDEAPPKEPTDGIPATLAEVGIGLEWVEAPVSNGPVVDPWTVELDA
jgi:hypothetical protein